MIRILGVLLLSAATFAADDAWTKVKDLKGGTELRIQKKGSIQPILARMDEANDERIVVVVKNTQLAIAKEDIDRIDYRPPQPGGRVTKETKTDMNPSPGANPPRGQLDTPGGTPGSSSSSVMVGSKPDFETIYRRSMGAPKKQ